MEIFTFPLKFIIFHMQEFNYFLIKHIMCLHIISSFIIEHFLWKNHHFNSNIPIRLLFFSSFLDLQIEYYFSGVLIESKSGLPKVAYRYFQVIRF